ncbi:TAXI family TRAP transporter solute-binding subunit [Peptoniphilus sp. MSJ-1]|uniref:TAXI family TRAP transporter solute-binding subunit n=1 Tax=Peptoniphilus ovalis TaxID=2841503 RepID=A0ABS6FIR7_9FIRM|nr:TAXI family TRAP transporter solute-binding subunit [Peptoniphilus ovalis]MBU5670077.1 TAXI family TRAP transporter solute-binding subunit [Peptoniphilus ovalis]
MLKIILIALLLLTGCGRENKYPINLPTANTTGTLYPLGASLAYMWNTNLDDVSVSSQSSNGGIENLNLIYEGDAEVSLGVTSIVYQAYNGEGKFRDRKNDKLRIIAGLYYNPNQVVVTKSSNINSLLDLKNKRFAPGSPGSTTEEETKIHLEGVGLNYPDDFSPVYIGPSEASELIRNKNLDGLWIMAGTPTASVSELLTTADSKLIEISEDEVNSLKEKYPWYANYKIPSGTYPNQNDEINTSAIKMVLYTTSDVPDEIIYKMTKTFWENIDELKKSNKSLEELDIKKTLEDISNLPVHEGAKKYYREVGILN